MLVTINGIGNPKIQYKDHSNIQFDSLDDYLLLAKKCISKFANGLSKKMLKDEDAIAYVANSIMMADWRWDENYSNEQGTKKTKYSYRNQCAIWAIQTYATKVYKKPKKINKVYSMDHLPDDDGLSVHELLQDTNTVDPQDNMSNVEQKEDLSKLIHELITLDCLSARQQDYLKLYYFDNYTFDKIGKKYGVTREAVRQGLKKTLDIIRDFVKHE